MAANVTGAVNHWLSNGPRDETGSKAHVRSFVRRGNATRRTFFLAFLIVLGLIGAAAWAVRRFGSRRLGGAGARGQPRLAVIDYASVDARRRLILVRRDNVEHLLMIGGPTDVVVEPNIVRAVAAPREVRCRAPARRGGNAAARHPLAGNGQRIMAVAAGAGGRRRGGRRGWSRWRGTGDGRWPPHQSKRRRARSATRWPRSPTILRFIRFAPRSRAALATTRPHPVEPRPNRASNFDAELRMPTVHPGAACRRRTRIGGRSKPRGNGASPRSGVAQAKRRSRGAMREARAPAAAPRPPPPAPSTRRGGSCTALATAARRPRLAAARAARRPKRNRRARTPRPSQGKALYDTLEQEMASLLGRPAGKT